MEPTKQKNIAQPDKKDLGCLPTIKQPSPLAVSLLRLMVARENSTGGIPNNKKITLKDCNKIAERINHYINSLPDEYKTVYKNIYPRAVTPNMVFGTISKVRGRVFKYTVRENEFGTLEKVFLFAKKYCNEVTEIQNCINDSKKTGKEIANLRKELGELVLGNRDGINISLNNRIFAPDFNLERELARKLHILTLGVPNNEGSCLTALTNCSDYFCVKRFFQSALATTNDNIISYSSHTLRKSISGMYNIKNEIPPIEEINKLVHFICEIIDEHLYKDIYDYIMGVKGKSKFQSIKNIKELAEEAKKLFSSITGMQHSRGIPKDDEIRNLKKLCEELNPENWQTIFSSITGMQNGKGVPDVEKLKPLVKYCQDITKDIGKDKWIDILSSITGMQACKGIPDVDKLKSLVKYCKDITNDIGKDKWIDILSSITGMQTGKGVPNLTNLDNLFKSIILVIQGEEFSDLNELKNRKISQINIDINKFQNILSRISGNQNCLGIPNTKRFFEIINEINN